MMIQTAPPGEPHFLCSMRAHNALCGQFVRAFGNDDFERCEPHEEMVYVVSHHDYGWDEFDREPVLDGRSGLPCGIGTAPVPGGTDTGKRSADVNEARHLYCGLLSSMHSWGLYHGRYGFSEFRVRPGGSTSIPVGPGDREEVDRMLGGEIARQQRIREALAANPETAPLVEEARGVSSRTTSSSSSSTRWRSISPRDEVASVDLRHETEREVETYTCVPRGAATDAEVTLSPKGGGVYALDPFPFAGDRLEAVCGGRYLAPYGESGVPDDLAAALAGLPTETQTYTLVKG